MKNENGKWTTSEAGEVFDGDNFETKEEAIKNGKMIYGGKDFYVGQLKEVLVEELVDAEDVIDQAWQRANDDFGECAEEYLQHLSENEKKELTKILVGWFKKNNLEPDFYRIRNSEKVKITPAK